MLSAAESFCKSCGNKLQADAQFCPKCGASTKGLTSKASSGKVGGVDKRAVIAILAILVVLTVPVIPHDEIIYVSGQTTTTQIYQSTTYQTSLQPYSTVSLQSVPVYVGTIQYVQSQYYSYYSPYYATCVRGYYGIVRCGGYYSWPNLNVYTTTVTVSASQNVVNVLATTQPNGYLSTVTLTMANGLTMTYTNVFNSNLSQTGTSTAQVTITATSTVTQTTMVPATTVVSVPCNNCVPQHVTRYVSILQLLFGL
ncbi:MAG TPA: zinc ribbon domain-containing protein [Candidatus Acidoferrales bacterium]|nr:zinc ribbon domain-containing protein [Candidatus Acidoferrales bacterium]